MTIGPAIEDGFYYDFAQAEPFTPEDLARIEDGMREIAKADHAVRAAGDVARTRRSRFFRERGEPYKVEIIEGIDAARVSLYRQGDFIDLCRGPHVASTGQVKAFKLLSSPAPTGAATSGTRCCSGSTAPPGSRKEELDKHLWRLEEAKKRDHRKLGRELDLFELPRRRAGRAVLAAERLTLVRELEQFVRERARRARLPGDLDADPRQQAAVGAVGALGALPGEHVHGRGRGAALRPQADELPGVARCVYRHALRSYRDLPLRFAEHRPAAPQRALRHADRALRVRQFTQDDAHIFCRPDQIQDEITALLELVREWYKTFGSSRTFKLSTRPREVAGHRRAVGRPPSGALHDALQAPTGSRTT